MFAKIRAGSAERWCEHFLAALEGGEMPSFERPVPQGDAATRIVRVPRFRPVAPPPTEGAAARTTIE